MESPVRRSIEQLLDGHPIKILDRGLLRLRRQFDGLVIDDSQKELVVVRYRTALMEYVND